LLPNVEDDSQDHAFSSGRAQDIAPQRPKFLVVSDRSTTHQDVREAEKADTAGPASVETATIQQIEARIAALQRSRSGGDNDAAAREHRQYGRRRLSDLIGTPKPLHLALGFGLFRAIRQAERAEQPGGAHQ
jgi:hypothetical protein